MPIITSMLDLSFQLLAFFTLTFDPSTAREGQMQMALPAKEEKQAQNPNDIIPETEPDKDIVPDIALDLNIIVQSQTTGFTMVLEEGVVRSDVATVTKLREQLTTIFTQKLDKLKDQYKTLPEDQQKARIDEEIAKIGIRVRGDSKLPWKDMIQVMDACRLAGFVTVSPASPQDKSRGT